MIGQAFILYFFLYLKMKFYSSDGETSFSFLDSRTNGSSLDSQTNGSSLVLHSDNSFSSCIYTGLLCPPCNCTYNNTRLLCPPCDCSSCPSSTCKKQETNKILQTKKSYYPNMTYSGFEKKCDEEFPGSFPCTEHLLLKVKGWNLQVFPLWVFTMADNCLAYTSTNGVLTGKCLNTMSSLSLENCSCDSPLRLCCVL